MDGLLTGGGFSGNVLVAYLFGVLLVYLVGRMLLKPLQWVLKFIYNGVVGGIIVWIINFIGAQFGFTLALNPLTALTVGFLGVPGVVLLIVLKVIF